MSTTTPMMHEVLERILGARRQVVLLRGPAGCGKTSATLATYRHFCRQDRMQPRCLLLAPNAPAVRYMQRRVMEDSAAGVLISPRIATFAGLAGQILTACQDGARLLSPFRRHLLLRRIVDQLNRAGKLSAFAAVADTAGLILALDRSIAELKRAAVEPEALARSISNARGASRDLLEVYRRYQQFLLDGRTYDVEGQIWQARDHLAAQGDATGIAPVDSLEAVAVDGFTDFTPTQLEILALLGRNVQRVVITLPHAPDGRERMWHWTARTLNNVRRTFGADLEEIVLDAAEKTAKKTAGKPATHLQSLWEKVFDIDAERASLPEGIHIIAAPSIDAEVAATARRIKRLLIDGARPGRIAVLARSMEAGGYRSAVERIFRQHDIPVQPAPRRLTDEPIVRFVLDVAGLAREFSHTDVLGVIKSSYFRPQSLGDFDESSAAVAEMIIRTGNVLGGPAAYADAATRLLHRQRRDVDEDDGDIQLGPLLTSPGAIESASAMLDKLFEISTGRPTSGGLGGLIDSLELRPAAADLDEPALVARDLRALDTLARTLEELDGPRIGLPQLREALSAVTCPGERGESLVDVLDVLDARALRWDHVLLLGVGEGMFPRRFADRSLLREADRIAWADRGVVLDNRDDLTSREMLLFYLAVSRADVGLTLSYPASETSSSPGAPSTFLLAALGPFGGFNQADKDGIVQRISPGRLVPAEIARRRDAVNAAVAGLFDDESPAAGSALAWAAANATDEILQCSAGIWARHRRWSADHCDSYDGRITDTTLLEELARRFGEQTIFSASQFNAFGLCPWHYFARYVLKLEPLAQPQRQLEAEARGIFCHKVLFRLMTRLRDEQGGPVSLARLDKSRLLKALEQAVADESAVVESQHPPYPSLWQMQCDGMHDDLKEYLLTQHEADEFETVSIAFELGFGMDESLSDLLDPASRPEPVDIPTPIGPIRLRGMIDRIDRIGPEKSGSQAGLLVVDYKTGGLPSYEDMDAGRNLQLPLYAAAAEALFGGEKSLGGVFHKIGDRSVRHFSSLKQPRNDSRDFQQRRLDALETAGRFVTNMCEGRFDLLPTGRCYSWCPYRHICHYADARAELKTPGASADDGEGRG